MTLERSAIAGLFALAFTGCLTAVSVNGDGSTEGDGGSSDAGCSGGGCPCALPTASSPCSPNGLSCGYGSDPRPDCHDVAFCQNGIWSITANPCTPPPPTTCPPSLTAAQGQACSPDGAVCGYDGVPCRCTKCWGNPVPQCTPSDTWHCDQPNTTAGCPPGAPNVGSPCSQAGLTCNYECGENGNRTCEDGVWVATGSSCPISARRFKRDIKYLSEHDLADVADDLTKLRLATWEYVDPSMGSRRHLGFILDDAPMSPASDMGHSQVDLYAYTSMAVATLQVQAKEIEALRKEMERLRADLAHAKRCR